MMLIVVLCRLSASVVKQKLKISPGFLSKVGRSTSFVSVAVLSAAQWCCYSDLQTSLNGTIASCLIPIKAVNFCQETVPANNELIVSEMKVRGAANLAFAFQPLLPLSKLKAQLHFRRSFWSYLEALKNCTFLAGEPLTPLLAS